MKVLEWRHRPGGTLVAQLLAVEIRGETLAACQPDLRAGSARAQLDQEDRGRLRPSGARRQSSGRGPARRCNRTQPLRDQLERGGDQIGGTARSYVAPGVLPDEASRRFAGRQDLNLRR